MLLIRALLASNLGTFYACGAVLLLSTLFALAVPVVLNALLSYIESGDRTQGSWQGYALAGGLFALVLLQSVTEHQFWIIGVRCCMRAQVGPSLVFSPFSCYLLREVPFLVSVCLVRKGKLGFPLLLSH